jgi:hypothetical protein
MTQPENVAPSTATAATIKNGRNAINTQAEYQPNKSFTARCVISAVLGGGILTWCLQQFVRDRVEEVS